MTLENRKTELSRWSMVLNLLAGLFLLAGGQSAAIADPPHVRVSHPIVDIARRHIVLVLAGDTGFSPDKTNPDPAGVRKHGQFLTFDEALRDIAPLIDGDINFANLETVVSARTDMRAVDKAYNFVTHPDAVKSLVRHGFNLFSTANNHAFDFGTVGTIETLDNLRALGGSLAFAGTGMNREEAARSIELKAAGASLRFSAIGIGAGPAGDNRPGQLSIHLKSNQDLLIARSLDMQADFHMVSVHSGTERDPNPTGFQTGFMRDRLARETGFDLIIGHHAHVAQPVVMAGDSIVFFGLGNFLHHGTANMNATGICRDWSILARLHLVDNASGKLTIGAIEIVPIRNTHIRTERLLPEEASKRISVLNGLSARLDNTALKTRGLRFATTQLGSGLWCSAAAQGAASPLVDMCTGYSEAVSASSPAVPDCGADPKRRSREKANASISGNGKPRSGRKPANMREFWQQQSAKARSLRKRLFHPNRESNR
ncbi:MAG: CapA family protein [Nitratireductor sp.]